MTKQDVFSFAKYIIMTECMYSKSDDEIKEKLNHYIYYIISNRQSYSYGEETLNVLYEIRDNVSLITKHIRNLEGADIFDRLVTDWLAKQNQIDERFGIGVDTCTDPCGPKVKSRSSC